MKKNRSVLSVLEWCGIWFLILFCIGAVIGVIALQYQSTRDRGIAQYRRSLEGNLERAETMNLDQIRGGLRQWLVGYEELQVPTSYTTVHEKVEGALTEADALSERLPTMNASDFLRELSLLQGKVQGVPPISADLYGERNPWFSGFLRFVLVGTLTLVALEVFAVAVWASATYLASKPGKPLAPSSEPSDDTTSGGGGWSGSGGYPGVYEDTWRYPPPTYRPPPYW